jgi:hypothetical protein
MPIGCNETIVYLVIHKASKLKQLIEKDLDIQPDKDMELASRPIKEQELLTLFKDF